MAGKLVTSKAWKKTVKSGSSVRMWPGRWGIRILRMRWIRFKPEQVVKIACFFLVIFHKIGFDPLDK